MPFAPNGVANFFQETRTNFIIELKGMFIIMQKITSRKKLLLYGCSGLGVNMLNIIIGSYLCSALVAGGFVDHIAEWTYAGKDLVIPAVWGVIILVTKIIDGVIDLPFASFTDRLKTRWGRRRPSIVIGFVPMLISFSLFLLPLSPDEGMLNTVWFGIMLGIFYCFYTLTMLTFYATFAEVVDNEQDMLFLSNVKSVCDVVYFSLGFALIPAFISMGINIRIIALIFMPLSLTMLIPLFLLKERPTDGSDKDALEGMEIKTLTLGKAITESFKNKTFIFWMLIAAVLNFGMQLFLGGINEVFSTVGLNMTVVMACSFAPVPFTILLYNKAVKKWGLGVAFPGVLYIFSIGMVVMFLCNRIGPTVSEGVLTVIAVAGSLFVSLSLGAFFSITYTVPSHLAQLEYERTGIGVSSMYFAVQGLFEGVAAGLATGPMLMLLKDFNRIELLPLVVIAACSVALIMSLALPKTVSGMGKLQSEKK